jgi:mRNA-degrading endonuclease toxin of MazEF toxin-antitoxin module
MPSSAKYPKRGDVWHLNFSPAAGQEMKYKHFAIVISPDAYNRRTNLIYVAPISTTANLARNVGFQVSLTGAGTKTTGVIDLMQIRAVDFKSAERDVSYVESLPDYIVDEVLQRITPIFTGEE